MMWMMMMMMMMFYVSSFRAVMLGNQTLDSPRSLQMNVANAQIMDREVSSGIFDDSPANRILLIRALLDALMVTVNSSDTSSTFQELVITATVRFPNIDVNNLAGQALPVPLPSAGEGRTIPFGIRLHKSKSFGRKQPWGQVIYVKNHRLCWVVATYYAMSHFLVMKEIYLLEESVVNEQCDVQRRHVRPQMVALKKMLFELLEKPAAVLLEEALLCFAKVADLDIGECEQPTPEVYEQLGRALNLQIVILDESSNYKSTSIFPQRRNPETGRRMNVYDEARDTIYLLRVRYPVVDNFGAGIGSQSVYHYHGLVSADGLLRHEMKKMCLYCQSLYFLYNEDHACPARRKVSCLMCHRVKGAVASEGEVPCVLPSTLSYQGKNFCTTSVGGEVFKCSKCGVECGSLACVTEHERLRVCQNMRPCGKCGKRFLCVGELAPTVTRHRDASGKVKVEKIFPTEHINCFHCKLFVLAVAQYILLRRLNDANAIVFFFLPQHTVSGAGHGTIQGTTYAGPRDQERPLPFPWDWVPFRWKCVEKRADSCIHNSWAWPSIPCPTVGRKWTTVCLPTWPLRIRVKRPTSFTTVKLVSISTLSLISKLT
jgi:hypothetical protein